VSDVATFPADLGEGAGLDAELPDALVRRAQLQRALAALDIFAADPAGTGGIVVRAGAGPVRGLWLERLRLALGDAMPLRKIPAHIADDRLLGGLDLAASLSAKRPVLSRGILAEADGGVAVLAMAERVSDQVAARLASALDSSEVRVERDGFTTSFSARFGLVLLDESDADEDGPPDCLCDRLAFVVDLHGLATRDLNEAITAPRPSGELRAFADAVTVESDAIEALCATAVAFGVHSQRIPILALRAVRTIAAAAGREAATPEDVELAAQLVLAPRATRMPAPPADEDTAPPEDTPEPEMPDADAPSDNDGSGGEGGALEDRVLDAVEAALPAHLLDLLSRPMRSSSTAQRSGRAASSAPSKQRGRPIGIRRGKPEGGARLDIIATLRAAAPWQPMRRGETGAAGLADASIEVRADDFRLKRFKRQSSTTTIFVIDASGSAALQRLAEAKGAVELLLADCYVRRDEVALIAFRGTSADLLLPPTRSLVRAKRSLAALPGGGGTPLAAGLDAAHRLAAAIARKGPVPLIVVLTDGRANISRSGEHDRPVAREDALAAARAIRIAGISALVVDTSREPRDPARDLAEAMAARYLPLPHADAALVAQAVRNAAPIGASPAAGRSATSVA